jgi:hydrogenase nickel incorporation protein HypA/HybF
MHEAGIAAGILKSVTQTAEHARAGRVNSVQVTIGELTEVMEDALQFAWSAATKGTIAQYAVLEITMVAGRSRCLNCGEEYAHGRYDAKQCPVCQSYIVELLTGRELKVDAIDID